MSHPSQKIQQQLEELLPETYEAPRVVRHSAEELNGRTVDVNACGSGFDDINARRSDDENTGVSY